MKQRMTVGRWYRGVIVPPFGNHYYTSFLVSTLGIVRTILANRVEQKVMVKFDSRIDTAGVDAEKGVIYINDKYADGKFGRTQRDSDFTIAAICGIMVHETAHIAFSRKDLKPYSQYIEANTSYPFLKEIAEQVGNMVEDVFIEAEIDRVCPNLYWMLTYSQEAVFDPESKRICMMRGMAVTEPPRNMTNLANAFNVLIQHRCDLNFTCNPYIDEIYQTMMSAEEASTYEERDAIALKIYDALMQQMPKELKPGAASVFSAAIDDQATGNQSENNQENLEKVKRTTIGNQIGGTAKLFNDEVEKTKDYIFSIEEDSFGSSGNVVYIEEPVVAASSKPPIAIDARYTDLAKVARQRSTVNRPYGRDEKRGNNIRRLHRIATDQRIFAEQVEARNYKPMQVMVVCDCSGSMTMMNRLSPALSASIGAASSLMEGKCETAVYGHNADVHRPFTIHLYRLKGFQDRAFGLGIKASSLTTHASNGENRDGYALTYLAKKMNDKRRRRLIIIISDGKPNAHAGGYQGWGAKRHTKEAVDKIRRKGIEVISISIAKDAIEDNNFIYGEANNLSNEDPNVIAEIVQKLVLR